MLDEVNHVGPRKTIVQQLAMRGVQPEQIEKVLFRFVIWAESCLSNTLVDLAIVTHTGTIVARLVMFSTTLQRYSGQGQLLAAHLDI